jgi:diacylglycerol kinase family enzyme
VKNLQLKRRLTPKIETHQGNTVKILTKVKRMVHADARLFGETPVELEIVPNALQVITGFPKPGDQPALVKRTYLDP